MSASNGTEFPVVRVDLTQEKARLLNLALKSVSRNCDVIVARWEQMTGQKAERVREKVAA